MKMMMMMMSRRRCVCRFQVGRADIVVVGAGRAEMVQGDWLKEGSVLIDCGINHMSGECSLM